jgi:hypothetical protein
MAKITLNNGLALAMAIGNWEGAVVYVCCSQITGIKQGQGQGEMVRATDQPPSFKGDPRGILYKFL